MEQYVQFICSVLRGEPVVWPSSSEWKPDEYLEACGKHGVAALVYYWLHKNGDCGQLPDGLREKLKKHVLQVTALEISRTQELTRLLDACARNNIVPLLLKGAGLSYTHYPSPMLRERCDTDLFIDIDDIKPFCRVVTELGYSVAFPIYKSHQLSCIHSNAPHGDSLDVHWRISNASKYARTLEYGEVYERSVPVSAVPGAKTLANGDALLLACVHLAANPKHDADRLIWLYDVFLIAVSMQSEEMLIFARHAIDKQVQDVCLNGIMRANEYFRVNLSDEALRILSTPQRKISFLGCFKQSNLGLLLDDFIVLPGMRQKLALLRELFFPPGRNLLDQYNKSGLIWLPWLYLRHISGGMLKRLTLK